MAGKIIILNGSSSSGKTTLAKILQELLPEPYLYVSVDSFVHMLPERWLEFCSEDFHPEGIGFIPSIDASGLPIMKLSIGPWGEKLLMGYLHAVKGMAEAGNNVIADVIISEQKWQQIISQIFQDFALCRAMLYAPLNVLETRERGRWEPPGLARGRYNEVYSLPEDYDLFIDTSKTTPEESAKQIVQWLERNSFLP